MRAHVKEFVQITIPARDLERYQAAGWLLVIQDGERALIRKRIRTNTLAR